MSEKRITGKDLFDGIYQKLEQDKTYLGSVKEILDYGISNIHANSVLIDCGDCEVSAIVSYGGCEGIYVDLYVEGNITTSTSEDKRCRIGAFKTLSASYGAMVEMGKLCGLLYYYGCQFIEENY